MYDGRMAQSRYLLDEAAPQYCAVPQPTEMANFSSAAQPMDAYREEAFGALGLEPRFHVDKGLLKKQYYALSKTVHPDIMARRTSHGAGSGPADDIVGLNKAYEILSDDFTRARLFTAPVDSVDAVFLAECLDMESRLAAGEDLGAELRGRIEECKSNYTDPKYIAKWAYYRRLLDMS